MRTVNIVFEDKEFEKLKARKGKQSWHDFVIELVEGKDKQKKLK